MSRRLHLTTNHCFGSMYDWTKNVFILKVTIWCEDVLLILFILGKNMQKGDQTRTRNSHLKQISRFHTPSHFITHQVSTAGSEVLFFVAVWVFSAHKHKVASKSNEKIALRAFLVVSILKENRPKQYQAFWTDLERNFSFLTLIYSILLSFVVSWSKWS